MSCLLLHVISGEHFKGCSRKPMIWYKCTKDLLFWQLQEVVPVLGGEAGHLRIDPASIKERQHRRPEGGGNLGQLPHRGI